jgi:hypothetical protein
VALTAASYSVSEGSGKVTVGARRGGPLTGSVDVSFDTAGGTAHAGDDYAATSATLHFADGAADATIDVPIFDDSAAEGDETFTVGLSNPSGPTVLGSPSSATVTIGDNDVAAGGEPAPTPSPTPTPAPSPTPTPTPTVPLPLTAASVTATFKSFNAFTKVVTLAVTKVPAGGAVVLSCTPRKSKKACPLKRKTFRFGAGSQKKSFASLFKKRKLTPGTVIRIRITAPGAIGKVVSFTVRKGKGPTRVTTCVAPDGKRVACP